MFWKKNIRTKCQNGICDSRACTDLLLNWNNIAVFEADRLSFLNIMYETASALGTVGLTADLTSHLCRESQAVIIALMYIGRVGPMTIALLFAGKKNQKDRVRTLPTNNILVG